MRTFIAIPIPETVIAGLVAVVAVVVAASGKRGGRNRARLFGGALTALALLALLLAFG